MKIEIKSEEINNIMNVISKVVAKNNTLPIVEDVLIVAEKSFLTFYATDLDTSISYKTEEFILIEEGSICINADILAKTAKANPKQVLTLDYNSVDDKMTITSGKGKYSMSILNNVTEFPKLNMDVPENSVYVNAEILKQSLENALVCVSKDQYRPAMTGVYFDMEEDTRVVCTDAHTICHSIVENESKDMQSFIIPAKTAIVLKNAMPNSFIYMALKDNNAIFNCTKFTISARIIDAVFPKYRNIFPEKFEYSLSMNRGELIEICKRAALYGNKNIKDIFVSVQSPSSINIRAIDIDMATSMDETIKATHNLPENFEIKYNHEYILKIISKLSGCNLHMKLINQTSLVSLHGDNTNTVYHVMPIMPQLEATSPNPDPEPEDNKETVVEEEQQAQEPTAEEIINETICPNCEAILPEDATSCSMCNSTDI